MRFGAAVACCLLLSAIGASGQQAEAPASMPQVWGGQHVSLVLSEANTTFTFDCAQGVAMSPIKPDADGNFTVSGTYTPQPGGPVRKDAPPDDHPATYKGTIHGNTMHLEVVLENATQQPPPMTLTRGQAGHVMKCR